MAVRLVHSMGGTEAALKAAAVGFRRGAPGEVRTTTRTGWRDGRRISRRRAGLHGSNAYKRITMERVTALSYEFGHTGSELVGVGLRTGGGNLDMAQASDGLADNLEKRLDALIDRTLSL